jgi:hypothetical protein
MRRDPGPRTVNHPQPTSSLATTERNNSVSISCFPSCHNDVSLHYTIEAKVGVMAAVADAPIGVGAIGGVQQEENKFQKAISAWRSRTHIEDYCIVSNSI